MGRKNTSKAEHLRALRRTLGLVALIGGGLMAGTSVRADTLYLCKTYSGGLFWTNGRCADPQALIERIVTTQTDPDPAVECQHLSATITNLDNQARPPQTAQMQEWLSQQKRNARDRQFRLGY